MEAAFPIFPSFSARDSQNRLRRSFSFGVEFVFLKRRNGAVRANTGRAVGVDFPADQTSGRERRSPNARALHPHGYGHKRGRCLTYLRAFDSVEARSSKP